ncbi:3'-5'-exoribonuclease [Cryptotrichosporon argae]
MAATFDRRRIQAPEVSRAPEFDTPEAGPSKRERGPSEARPIYLKTGLISQANGSAYIESGGVKIACSVYGPRPKPPPYTAQGALNLEIKFAPFASHPRRAPLRDTEPVPLSTLLTQLLLPAVRLDTLPKSQLDIFLVVLEADSDASVLGAGLTVASAAVADAGVEMSGLGVGGVVSKLGLEILVDPSADETRQAAGIVTTGFLPALGTVTNVWLTGELEIDDACAMIERSVATATETHAVVARALVEGAEERGQ